MPGIAGRRDAFFRGGGGGTGKSEIIVTAPSGSTVTAACGSIVKTAAEKNGVWTFRGCGIGEWTLTATHPDEAEPATETVNITEDGQLMRYHITLAFWRATITTTYPAGAVCTCSNGDVVLTAPDTSGNHIFVLSRPGEWTVSANNGVDSTDAVVNVTEQINYEVELLFALFLLKDGEDNTIITGGWQSGTKESGSLYITSRTYPKNKIDVSEYTSIRVSYSECYNATLSVRNTVGGNNISSIELVKTETKVESALDVSALQGSFFIVFDNISSSEPLRICAAWLEK